MGFQDLADDDLNKPLTEPTLIANVLDLCISAADRQAGAIAALLCDADGRLVQPTIISDIEPDPTEAERDQLVGVLVDVLAQVDGSLMLAVARRDGLSVTPDDVAWCNAAARGCAGSGVRFLGGYVVTMTGSREVPNGDAVAV